LYLPEVDIILRFHIEIQQGIDDDRIEAILIAGIQLNMLIPLQEEQSAGERERRPFNRETDLELPTNIVTPAKRRALMKDSARSLESKFTHGTKSFL